MEYSFTLQIWALAVSADSSIFVTGGIDSKIIIWEDCTQEEIAQQQEEDEKRIQEYVSFYFTRG